MSWLESIRRLLGRATDPGEVPEDELRGLLDDARSLAREARPERDLWPQIARRIAEPVRSQEPSVWQARVGPLPGWAALAAAAVVLVVVTSLATSWLGAERPLDDDRARAIAAAARTRDGVSDVREALLAILERQRESIPPETMAVVEENLMAIDRAVAEIQIALERHPGSNALNLLLAEAYRREVELLERLEQWRQVPEESQS